MHYALLTAEVGSTDTTVFWDSEIGTWIKGLLLFVGIIVVLIAIFKAVKEALNGKFGAAAKVVLGATVIAAFCFHPPLVSTLIDVVGNVAGKVLSSLGDVGKAGK